MKEKTRKSCGDMAANGMILVLTHTTIIKIAQYKILLSSIPCIQGLAGATDIPVSLFLVKTTRQSLSS